ncbi:MAG: Na/Pi symporter [Steroidobacteraceae bacterium]
MNPESSVTLAQLAAHLLAGLGLFFAGIRLLSDNLRRLADHRLHTLITSVTASGRGAATFGFVGGAVMQSMNAMVFVLISLVKAGIMDVRRAHPVINFANLGSSVLVVLAAFKPKLLILVLVGVAGLLFYSDRERPASTQDLIRAVLGISLLFLGLTFIKDLGDMAGALPWVQTLFSGTARSVGLAFVAGVGVAFLVHSASSVTIVTMALASSGVVDVQHAMFIVFGAALGAALSTRMLGAGHRGYAQQLILYQFTLKTLGLVLMLPLALLEFVGGIPLLAAGVEALPTSIALNIALIYLAYQLACDLVMHPLHHRVADFIESRAPQTVEEELGKLRYLYPGAEKYPGTALALVEQEQLRVIELLPSYLDGVRAETVMEGPAHERVSLHRGCSQVVLSCGRFLEGMLSASPGEEVLERTLVLQNRNQLLAGLQDSLNELVLEAGNITTKGAEAGEAGVLLDGMLESLHVLLLTLHDAARGSNEDDLVVLQALTGDRSELMHSIRSRLLAGSAMDSTVRESLLSAISLFERLVWILRRYALLLNKPSLELPGEEN